MIQKRIRMLVVLAIATLTMCTTSAVAPSTASALECMAPVVDHGPCSLVRPGDKVTWLASRNHTGWAYMNLNHCPSGMMCAAVFQQSTLAWRWTGRRWMQSSLNQGWVYLYPYAGDWRWAWTQRTGWLAVSGGRFELRSY